VITTRHVLTHTTGWPNWRAQDSDLLLLRPPGSAFDYSGEGFVCLQQTLEAIWDEPFEALMRRLVFDPLGMATSGLVWRAAWNADAADRADGDGKPLDPWRPESPNAAYSLHTTAADYARLIAAYLDTTLRERFPAVYAPQSRINGLLSWTLGWGWAEEEGRRTLWQWGDNPGFKAFAVLEPDAGVGLVIFTNGDNGQRISRRILLNLLGLDHPAFTWRNIRM